MKLSHTFDRDWLFYCTNHIRLTAGRYSSITSLTIFAHAVALLGGLEGLKLCGPDSKPQPLNLKPNSITLSGSKLVADRFEAGRQPASNQLA